MKKVILISILIVGIVGTIWSAPPNWQELTGMQYNMILIAEVNFNNQPFIGTGQNMVAAFGPGGESDCRDIAIWDATNQIWYFTIIGNINGEEVSFKIYDESTDLVHESLNSIVWQTDLVLGSSSAPFQILMPSTSTLDSPENVTISINTAFNAVILTWSSVTDAQAYYIYSGSTPDVDTTVAHTGRATSTMWIGAIDNNKPFYVIVASDQASDNGNKTIPPKSLRNK